MIWQIKNISIHEADEAYIVYLVVKSTNDSFLNAIEMNFQQHTMHLETKN